MGILNYDNGLFPDSERCGCGCGCHRAFPGGMEFTGRVQIGLNQGAARIQQMFLLKL